MSLNIVVALIAEARPLIDRLGLKREPSQQTGPYAVFCNADVSLIISGIGKVNAAAATAWLAATRSPSAWLNLGICGHGAEPVGHLLRAVKIVDEGTCKTWYPPCLARRTVRVTTVHTIEHVEQSYLKPVAYEMEASGFYPVASRMSTGELCQVLKIVSDTPDTPTSRLTADAVSSLVGEHIDTIAQRVSDLCELMSDVKSIKSSQVDDQVSQIKARWHFTVTQTHELKRLFRHLLLRDDPKPFLGEIQHLSSARDVLEALRLRLSQLPMHPDGGDLNASVSPDL